MKWYEKQTEWAEDHEYDDPTVSSNNLRNWFMEIIKKFPQMNGRYALSDEEIDNMENDSYITDYSIGKDMIYAAFAWSLVDEAHETVKRLAKEYNVGFFDVSSDKGEIIFDDVEII
ncbi:MAG: lactate utilization protein [Azoarcus sp.]|nr:lactate utilization protein [Azoarcus sp.]